jgi:hypothetical protein
VDLGNWNPCLPVSSRAAAAAKTATVRLLPGQTVRETWRWRRDLNPIQLPGQAAEDAANSRNTSRYFTVVICYCGQIAATVRPRRAHVRSRGPPCPKGDRQPHPIPNNQCPGILRGGPLEFVPIDTLSANRYARTPASFVHRMGASTHDLCSPGRDTRGQPLDITKTRLRLDTPVSVLPGRGWECPSG